MEDLNAPATKGDIAAIKGDIAAIKGDIAVTNGDVAAMKGDVAAMKGDIVMLRSEMNHGYNDVVERIADSETRMLRAFYAFAESNQTRMGEIEVNETALRSRVATLETRILVVEKRLNLPPAA